MSKKKILWVSHFLPFPAKGGAQIRSFNLIKQLAGLHEVDLFCVVQEDVAKNYFDSVDSALAQADEAFSSFCKKTKFHIVKTSSSFDKKINLIKSVFGLNSYAITRLSSQAIFLSLQTYIKNTKYDYVHFDTVALSCFSSLFKSDRIVLNHHNIESIMMGRRAQEASNYIYKIICFIDAWKIRRSERKMAKIAVHHLVCSDLDRDRLHRIFPNINAVTIPNGIDCKNVVTGSREVKAKSLLFIGGLDWYPNADAIRFLLKQVWGRLTDEVDGITLDVIGKRPPADIVEVASKYGNIKLHGFVDDISHFYRSNWLYICPIMDGGGTKLKVLDAMANGIPLLAHPVSMEGIDAVEGQHYWSAEASDDFVRQVKALSHADQEKINRVAENAQRLMFEKYDYELIGQKLAGVYQ